MSSNLSYKLTAIDLLRLDCQFGNDPEGRSARLYVESEVAALSRELAAKRSLFHKAHAGRSAVREEWQLHHAREGALEAVAAMERRAAAAPIVGRGDASSLQPDVCRLVCAALLSLPHDEIRGHTWIVQDLLSFGETCREASHAAREALVEHSRRLAATPEAAALDGVLRDPMRYTEAQLRDACRLAGLKDLGDTKAELAVRLIIACGLERLSFAPLHAVLALQHERRLKCPDPLKKALPIVCRLSPDAGRRWRKRSFSHVQAVLRGRYDTWAEVQAAAADAPRCACGVRPSLACSSASCKRCCRAEVCKFHKRKPL